LLFPVDRRLEDDKGAPECEELGNRRQHSRLHVIPARNGGRSVGLVFLFGDAGKVLSRRVAVGTSIRLSTRSPAAEQLAIEIVPANKNISLNHPLAPWFWILEGALIEWQKRSA
jgi:hypothetical protein